MHLWTDYEGRTIAAHYTLGRLLRSEGRNGFFATSDKDGHPAVIRLTEAHFDEDELLSRWRHVADVHQQNLIEIEQVGQTNLDGVPLTYALMEPEDANLGDVLKERPLTSAETTQVAKAVFAALQALHASGLVHEHIEPANILAVGETVKLRSDCVRECVPDGDFSTEQTCAGLRRRDIHDFGLLLLRCLTLETEWSPAHHNLPDPFKRIIPRALDSAWTLDQIGATLDPAHFAPNSPARPAYLSQATPAGVEPQRIPLATSAASPAEAPAPSPRPLVPPGVRHNAPMDASGRATLPPTPASRELGQREPAIPVRFRTELLEPTHTPSKALWACAVAALVVLLIGWHFFSRKPEATSPAPPSAPIVNSAAVPQRQSSPAPRTIHSAPVTAAPERPSAATSASETGTPGAPGWYVIAYTYNHQAQAATKAQRLRRTHGSLHPQVFTPTGHAPFFVALGGPFSNPDEAEAIYRRARRAGLPRDAFVRRY